LSCHYRIAVPSAKLGVPEVKLGLLPGAGGTQRLPRVAGIEAAVEMTATGNPLSAAKAESLGLVDDRRAKASLPPTAIAFARDCIAKGPRPSSERRSRATPR
jgi:3-hydroxyacyl-CoA dehydrogenase